MYNMKRLRLRIAIPITIDSNKQGVNLVYSDITLKEVVFHDNFTDITLFYSPSALHISHVLVFCSVTAKHCRVIIHTNLHHCEHITAMMI